MKKLDIYLKAGASLNEISKLSQLQIDKLILELGGCIYNDNNSRKLAELSVADTGIGNVKDKIIKNKKNPWTFKLFSWSKINNCFLKNKI